MAGNRLELQLSLDSELGAALRREAKGVRKFADDTRSRFDKLSATFGKVRTAINLIVGAAAVRQLSRVVSQYADFADRVGKLNARLGLSTQLISELRFAGEQSGVAFNQLAIGLQRAIRRIDEFRATGKGSAAEAIDVLGIAESVKAGESFEQLLPKIADGFARIRSQQERVRVGFKLFDSEGVSLIQLLQGGSGNLDALRRQARGLGGSLTRRDTKAAERYNDALNALQTRLRTFGDEIAKDIVPVLGPALEGITDIINSPSFREAVATISGLNLAGAAGTAIGSRIGAGNAPRARPNQSGGGFARGPEGFTRPEVEELLRLYDQGQLAPALVPALSRALRARGFRLEGVIPLGGTPVLPEVVVSGAPPPNIGSGFLSDFSAQRRFGQLASRQGATAGFGARQAIQAIREDASAFNQTRSAVLDLSFALEDNLANAFLDVGRNIDDVGETMKRFAANMLQAIAQIIARMVALKIVSSAFGFFAGGLGAAQSGVAATGASQVGLGGLDVGSSLRGAALGAGFARGGVITAPNTGGPALLPINLHGKERVRIEPLGNDSGGMGTVQPVFIIEGGVSDVDSFKRGILNSRELIGEVAVQRLRNDPRLKRALAF